MASKFDGVIGIGVQAGLGSASTADFYPVAEDANINSEPVHHERIPNAGLRLQPRPAGFNHSFDLTGMEGDVTHIGRLLMAMLGTEAFSTPAHTITYGVSKYLSCFIDRNVVLTGSDEGEYLRDVRGESFEFEVNPRQISRCSLRGPGTDKSTTAGMTQSLPSGSPITWDMLLASNSGYFKVQLNDGAFAADQTVQSFKFGITRTQKNDKITAESAQPVDILQGNADITFEFAKEFASSTDYAAFVNQHEIGVEALFFVGQPEQFKVTIPHATFEAPAFDGVGSGEDEILFNVSAKAFFDGSDEIITVVATDAVSW